MASPTTQIPGIPVPNAPAVRSVFQFPSRTATENIHTRANGHLLLSTLNSGDFYTLNPHALLPNAKVVITLPNVTGLTGIATIDKEASIFAVCGGEHITFGFLNMALFVVQIDAEDQGVILDRIPVNATLNGMASLPTKPHIILVRDYTGGSAGVVRVNTRTRKVDIAIDDPALSTGINGLPIGTNGLKIQGCYLYYTNSGQGTFGRFPIDEHGNKTGDAEILATIPLPCPRVCPSPFTTTCSRCRLPETHKTPWD